MACNRLKLNNDKTDALVVGFHRRVSVSLDNRLQVGSHDISFKRQVKSLRVYTDATLSMAKHTDHNSRSVYLEIIRISSTCYPLTTADQTYHLQKFKIIWLVVFRKKQA